MLYINDKDAPPGFAQKMADEMNRQEDEIGRELTQAEIIKIHLKLKQRRDKDVLDARR